MKSLISPGVGELSAAVKYRYIDSKETGFFTEIKGLKVMVQYFRPSNPVSG
ncbi:hypothetical protein QUB47_18765 [Microcoleus sp. AT9_B5]